MILFLLGIATFSLAFRLPHEVNFPHLGPDNVTQISGYITVNGTILDGTHLFYWFFESRHNPENAPFIVWLTGGPGCSSMLALLSENGPYTVNSKTGDLEMNINSWNTYANVIWVDQPTGTGYSYTNNVLEYDINEKQVADQMWKFLQEFFQEFPKYQKNEFFLIGESYAGHYVPAISYKIDEANIKREGPVQINMKGLAIGNGWVDPYNQYLAYTEFAKTNKLINDIEYAGDIVAGKACQKLVQSGIWPVAFYECQLYLEAVMQEISLHQGFEINPYNYKIKCTDPPLCYDFSSVDVFLNKESTKNALGAKKAWKSCNMIVHTLLLGDWMKNLEVHIPMLLQNKYRVLVYSGELDFICNWKGGETWTHNMKWAGQDEFNKEEYVSWKVGGTEAGLFKSYEGFTFLRVENAGHMVPMDQGVNALNMLKHFTDDIPFSS